VNVYSVEHGALTISIIVAVKHCAVTSLDLKAMHFMSREVMNSPDCMKRVIPGVICVQCAPGFSFLMACLREKNVISLADWPLLEVCISLT